MADRLARIYGTEEDKVNCPFYHKIGACRHGDRCSRLHNKPLFSQTVCLKAMFNNPLGKIYGDSQRAARRLTRDEERDIQAGFEVSLQIDGLTVTSYRLLFGVKKGSAA